MHITIEALPLARLYRFSISLQHCHLSDLLHWFQLQPYHLPDLLHGFQFTAGPLARLYFVGFSLQTLLHWFQFTAVPLVRLYCIGSCLQPSLWSDFIALVSVYSRAAGQTLLHWFQLAVLLFARLYFIVFSLRSPATCQTLSH